MDAQQVQSIKEVYEQEFSHLEADREKYEYLLDDIDDIEEGPSGPEKWKDVEAMANRIETLYSCFERIFKRIARKIDGMDFRGETWHKDLLNRISQDTDDRPAVINDETKARLMEFLKFRHYVRKNYVQFVEWKEMVGLVESYPRLYSRVQEDLDDFVSTLENAVKEE
jgi:hypothetical protein